MIEYEIRAIDPEKDLLTLDERVSRLPEWRRRDALSYHQPIDRLQSCIGYELVTGLLLRFFRIPPEDLRIEYDDNGKPSVMGHPDIYISIAHCRVGVMAAVSDCPIGCDIEEIRRPFEQYGNEVMEYCYSPGERALIASADDPETEFTRIWTVKESLYKLDNTLDIEHLDTTIFVTSVDGNPPEDVPGTITRAYENNADYLPSEIEVTSTVTPSFVATVAKPDDCGLGTAKNFCKK